MKDFDKNFEKCRKHGGMKFHLCRVGREQALCSTIPSSGIGWKIRVKFNSDFLIIPDYCEKCLRTFIELLHLANGKDVPTPTTQKEGN